jgi:hypothetical protein
MSPAVSPPKALPKISQPHTCCPVWISFRFNSRRLIHPTRTPQTALAGIATTQKLRFLKVQTKTRLSSHGVIKTRMSVLLLMHAPFDLQFRDMLLSLAEAHMSISWDAWEAVRRNGLRTEVRRLKSADCRLHGAVRTDCRLHGADPRLQTECQNCKFS